MSKNNFIKINDDDTGIPIDLLSIPIHYKEHLHNVMIPSGLILDRTEALATQIFNDCNNKPLVCLCVLKSGYKFFSDLTEKIQSRNRTNGKKSLPIMIDFIRTNVVNNQTEIIGLGDLSGIKDKNILIVDNIVDTGNTLFKLIETLKSYNPLNIKSCSLLVKRNNREDQVHVPNYVGFEIPNKLVVGYALDLNEHFRDLEHICMVKPSSIDKFKK